MLDLAMYTDPIYRQRLHACVRDGMRSLARVGGSNLPLCVVSHGFGSVVAVDFFTELQHELAAGTTRTTGASPLERGQTLAFMCTLGSPLPLLMASSPAARGSPTAPLLVPAPGVMRRWPHLRAGWSNFYHCADCLGYALRISHPIVSLEAECRRRHKAEQPVQSMYFVDVVDCVRPISCSLAWIWQDTNRSTTARSRPSD